MKEQFRILQTTRNHFINFLKFYDLKSLNKVPSKFNNSIFWNAAHVVVTQQLLCYYLSDNTVLVENEWIQKYKKGTKVEQPATENDLQDLIELLSKTAEQLKKDYLNEKFTHYKSYETSYGFALDNIEQAVMFNNTHESLHLGYVMAMRKYI